jgi:hypothetical protein
MKSYRVVILINGEKIARAVDAYNHIEVFGKVKDFYPGDKILFIQEMKLVDNGVYVDGPIKYCIDDTCLPNYDDKVRPLTAYEAALLIQKS